MTETEWLRCNAPEEMLAHIGAASGAPEVRKLRLAAVACCRRIWHLLDEEPLRNAVEVAERFADGEATEDERRAAELACEVDFPLLTPKRESVLSVVGSMRPYFFDGAVLGADNTVRGLVSRDKPWQKQGTDRKRVGRTERAAQIEYLRDIFGNPFCPVAFSPSWRTSTAVALAGQMYESRDFSAMPILADALQDAGCDNADIPEHCRGPGPHVRGCWVVDLVLGKE